MEAHDLQVLPYNGWLTANGRPSATRAIVYRDPAWHPNLVQLDMQVLTPDGRTLIESVTGIGSDGHASAVEAGIVALSESSLHVLLETFWETGCPEVDTETWQTTDGDRRALLGPMNIRGPLDFDELPAFIQPVRDALEARASGPLHWLRIFHCCGPEPFTEVLFDNEDWPELRAAIDALPWPKTAGYTSVRFFMTLSDPVTMRG